MFELSNIAGLNVALVEKFDFSSGTSSRSTKLIHGGVRYLQKAVFGLDLEQYRMVKEALAERGNLCQIAPHLAHPLPIMLPIYRYSCDGHVCKSTFCIVNAHYLTFWGLLCPVWGCGLGAIPLPSLSLHFPTIYSYLLVSFSPTLFSGQML